jgi:PAS domain S-box-containing protein
MNTPAPTATFAPPPARERALILAVDDVAQNQALLNAVLRQAGYDVITAGSGQQAIELVQQHHPDLILLDVMMPGMDGYETCRQIKALQGVHDMPVIFVTALHEVQDETQGFDAGAVDYIHKPISVPLMLARVKLHLAQNEQRRSLEGMFESVVESAPDAFILSNTDGLIVRVNARAEQLFGYTRQELVGQPIERLIPLRLRERHIQQRQDFPRQPQPLRMGANIICLRQDGSEFPGDISISPLQTHHEPLHLAVVRDMSERKRQETQLRALAAQLESSREEERKHIAREVHDELGQVLTALRMDVSLLRLRFAALDPQLAEKVQDMKTLVDRGIQGVRNVAANLRPAALDMGLVAALEWLCDESSSRADIPCTLQLSHAEFDLDEARAVTVFRIVQESITNVARYAQASKIDIHLEQSGNALRVSVQDDGQGFDPAQAAGKKSFGLLGMRERALRLGGRLDIHSTPQQGTTVVLTIPLHSPSGSSA